MEHEALAVRDKASATREKIRRIGHGSVIDDYIFDRFEPEAHPVGDEARVRREKIRSIEHGSVIDDYIFDRTRT